MAAAKPAMRNRMVAGSNRSLKSSNPLLPEVNGLCLLSAEPYFYTRERPRADLAAQPSLSSYFVLTSLRRSPSASLRAKWDLRDVTE